jgi:hypothetical protein
VFSCLKRESLLKTWLDSTTALHNASVKLRSLAGIGRSLLFQQARARVKQASADVQVARRAYDEHRAQHGC